MRDFEYGMQYTRKTGFVKYIYTLTISKILSLSCNKFHIQRQTIEYPLFINKNLNTAYSAT